MLLTLRQQTALYLLGEGYNYHSIAEAMGQSEHVSRDQVRRACKKLRAASRSHAAVMLRDRYA